MPDRYPGGLAAAARERTLRTLRRQPHRHPRIAESAGIQRPGARQAAHRHHRLRQGRLEHPRRRRAGMDGSAYQGFRPARLHPRSPPHDRAGSRRIAAERASAQEIADLDNAWRQMRDSAGDPESFTEADVHVPHRAAQRQPQPGVPAAVERHPRGAEIMRCMPPTSRVENREDAVLVHGELVEALRMRDKARRARLLQPHARSCRARSCRRRKSDRQNVLSDNLRTRRRCKPEDTERACDEDHQAHHLYRSAALAVPEDRDRRGHCRLGRAGGRRPGADRSGRRPRTGRLPDRQGPVPDRGPLERHVSRRLLSRRRHPHERHRRHRPGAVGHQGQGARPAGPCAARRPGARQDQGLFLDRRRPSRRCRQQCHAKWLPAASRRSR